MKYYKTFKTTMGRKFRVRMSEQEIAERQMFHLVLFALPFFSSILLTAVLFMRG